MTLELTLIKPDVKYPVKKQGAWGDVGVPLGLLYLGAYIREHNDVDVAIKDHRLDHALGKSRDLENDISSADVVGVGACTAESPEALEILKEAKQIGKTTILGGLFGTFNASDVLREGFVDYVVRGEGEIPLSNLLTALEKGRSPNDVKGISFLHEGGIVHNPPSELIQDLDSLPMPAYDLIETNLYAQFGPASIYAARGCPRTCDFCTLNEMWDFKQRRRSYDSVIGELALLKEFGFSRVHFKDESVTFNKRRAHELFGEIERANLGLSYKAKSRIEQLDEPLLNQMIAAGIDTIHSGIESVVQTTLDRIGKKTMTEESVRTTYDLMQGVGATFNPVYLFGSPEETPYDLQANADFIREVGQSPDVITYISFMTPHPGTSIERSQELEIVSNDFSRYTHKQPVAVPKSLGENGFRLMVDTYHQVAEDIGMQEVNPPIDQAYVRQVLKADSSSKYESGEAA